MTTPMPPTGLTTQSVHARLVAADGQTTITATSGAALISAAPNQDPPVVVSENIYEDRVPDGTEYPPNERILKFYAGQIIPTSQWTACFPAGTVTAISPATGPAAGGTPVQITGMNFTPDTTVTIGGDAVADLVVVSPELITCNTPAHADGVVNVVVTTDSGAVTATGAFTYAG